MDPAVERLRFVSSQLISEAHMAALRVAAIARAGATAGTSQSFELAQTHIAEVVERLRAANDALLLPCLEAQAVEAASRMSLSLEQARELVSARWE